MIVTKPYHESLKNQKAKNVENLRNEFQQILRTVLNDQDSTVEDTSMKIPSFLKNVGNTTEIMENITDIVNHFHNYEESSTTNVQKQKNIKNEITTFKNFYKTYILQKIKENKEKLIDSAIQEIDNQKFTQEAKNMLSKEPEPNDTLQLKDFFNQCVRNYYNFLIELSTLTINYGSQLNYVRKKYLFLLDNRGTYEDLREKYQNLLSNMQTPVKTDDGIFNKERIFQEFIKRETIKNLQNNINNLFKECREDLYNNLDVSDKLRELKENLVRFSNLYKFFLLSTLENIRFDYFERFVKSVQEGIDRDELSEEAKNIHQNIVGNKNTLKRFEEKVMLYNDGTSLGKARTELYQLLKPLETKEQKNDARFELLEKYNIIRDTPVKKFYELCQEQYISDSGLSSRVFNDFRDREEKAKKMKLTEKHIKNINKQLHQYLNNLYNL